MSNQAKSSTIMKYQWIFLSIAICIALCFAEEPCNGGGEGGEQGPQNINICANVSDNIFVTDITNCSSYYICINEQPIPQQCKPNYYFNAATQTCTLNSSVCLSCQLNVLSVQPLYKTCNKYIMCYNGEPQINSCADNLQFNQAINKCDLPVNVDCVENRCPVQNEQVLYTSSSASCDQYYICMRGVQYKETCAKGLYFNPSINRCDYAANVQCTISGGKRSIVFNDKLEPEPAIGFECPPLGIFYYNHARSNQYYVCADGQASILTCAYGLVYDESTHECRLPTMIGQQLEIAA